MTDAERKAKAKADERLSAPVEQDDGGERVMDLNRDGRVTETRRTINEMGVQQIMVSPRSGTEAASSDTMPHAIPTRPESIWERARQREMDLSAARQEVVPAVETYKQAGICNLFRTLDGYNRMTSGPVWCQQDRCPSWNAGACLSNALAFREMLASRVQPETMAEHDKLIARGGRDAADTEQRVKQRADAIGAERAARQKAEQAEAEERARLRRVAAMKEAGIPVPSNAPTIGPGGPGASNLQRQVAYDRARQG